MNLHSRKRLLRVFCGVMAALLGTIVGPRASADDALLPVDLRQVKVGGEMGRRIDVTVDNNLLVLAADQEFLAPFRAKAATVGYTGLGNLIDASVRFAAYTGNEKVIALKKHLVAETLKTQEPDGYIGMMAPSARMWSMFDVHELGYIIFGLTSDYHFFGEKPSLEAARRVADYILERWSTMPSDWEQQTRDSVHMLVTGAAGEFETWTNDQGGSKGLGETCATAYQLRFYDNLLRLEGSSRYGDLMERVIYNALFAAQSPDGRQIRYYTPLDGNRIYWPPDTSACPI